MQLSASRTMIRIGQERSNTKRRKVDSNESKTPTSDHKYAKKAVCEEEGSGFKEGTRTYVAKVRNYCNLSVNASTHTHVVCIYPENSLNENNHHHHHHHVKQSSSSSSSFIFKTLIPLRQRGPCESWCRSSRFGIV